MRRTLVLIRHAKAEAIGSTDHARQLAPRGHRDAEACGFWLKAAGIVPDQVLVSTATRTRETFAAIAEAAGWDTDPWFDTTLYGADITTLLELIRVQDSAIGTVVVIGHNPTIADIAYELDDLEGAELEEFPTSAIAVFDFDGEWTDVDLGQATVRAYAVPRG